ncbi:MAG: DUF192 domain-containing protein [Gemmatimonadota bacterium]
MADEAERRRMAGGVDMLMKQGAFRLAAVSVAVVGWAAIGCEEGGGSASTSELVPAVAFDTTTARIETAADTFPLTVEVAETDEQRGYGLMERTSLPESHGMIFRYDSPRPPDAGFYMYRTRIPLDIAFLDGDGRIVAIEGMEPCESPYPSACPRYAPGEPYTAALEVNAGYFESRGIGIGDRVVVLDDGEPAG